MANRGVAVVTGANRGIGFEICRQLAKKGALVVLTARDPERGKEAAEQLSREGTGVVFHPLDVVDGDSISTLATYLREELRGVDILVNNAGVFLDQRRGALDVPMQAVRSTLETNLLGAWRLVQA